MRAFKIIITTFLVIVLLLLCLSIYEYFSWKKSFLNSRSSMICTDFHNDGDITNIERRVKEYVFSKEGTASISFSVEEMLVLFRYIPVTSNSVFVDEMCIKPSKGMWLIFLNIKVYGVNIPWIQFDLVKDARETAQLYVKDFSFGGVSFLNIFSSSIMEEVNEGISNAIVIVNENNFLGRDIHNIELLENEVVIR